MPKEMFRTFNNQPIARRNVSEEKCFERLKCEDKSFLTSQGRFAQKVEGSRPVLALGDHLPPFSRQKWCVGSNDENENNARSHATPCVKKLTRRDRAGQCLPWVMGRPAKHGAVGWVYFSKLTRLVMLGVAKAARVARRRNVGDASPSLSDRAGAKAFDNVGVSPAALA